VVPPDLNYIIETNETIAIAAIFLGLVMGPPANATMVTDHFINVLEKYSSLQQKP